MDMTTIITVPLLAGFGGWLGSFLTGYAGEKGKNLATHEDIGKLVDQVRAITKTTEEIKAKISDEVWDRQRRWELKRDQIFLIAERVSVVRDALIDLNIARTMESKARTEGGDFHLHSEVLEIKKNMSKAYSDLRKVLMTTKIICSENTSSVLSDFQLFIGAVVRGVLDGTVGTFDNLQKQLNEKHQAVVDALKAELQ